MLQNFYTVSGTIAFLAVLTVDSASEQQRSAAQVKSSAPNDFDLQEMYEDIEVMRRILRGNLPVVATTSRVKASSPVSHLGMVPAPYRPTADPLTDNKEQQLARLGYRVSVSPKSEESLPTVRTPVVEGVYLKGRGVVFSATVSELSDVSKNAEVSSLQRAIACANCHSNSIQQLTRGFQTEASQQLSVWERERRLLVGENEPAKAPRTQEPTNVAICHPGLITEVVLKLMTENGHHFTELSDDEQLTVIVSFRPNLDQLAQRNTSSEYVYAIDSNLYQIDSVANRYLKTNSKLSDLPREVRDRVLLGDLHSRQGKHDEAIKAYQQAINLLASDPHEGLTNLNLRGRVQIELLGTDQVIVRGHANDVKKMRQRLSELFQKVAQAHLALNNIEEAQKALGVALKQKQQSTESENKHPDQASFHLPTRLIISAAKKSLEQVAAKQIGNEDFMKSVSIEHLIFAARGNKDEAYGERQQDAIQQRVEFLRKLRSRGGRGSDRNGPSEGRRGTDSSPNAQ